MFFSKTSPIMDQMLLLIHSLHKKQGNMLNAYIVYKTKAKMKSKTQKWKKGAGEI